MKRLRILHLLILTGHRVLLDLRYMLIHPLRKFVLVNSAFQIFTSMLRNWEFTIYDFGRVSLLLLLAVS